MVRPLKKTGEFGLIQLLLYIIYHNSKPRFLIPNPSLYIILNNYYEMIINSLFRHVFFVGFCTFVNMYRRDLLWHLREHHRKTGYSDEMMLREMVKWPKDLRKIVCIKCTESEANENATWLCCDPNEVCTYLYSVT